MKIFSKKHTYLISYVIPNQYGDPNKLGFGNSTLYSSSKGLDLIDQAIEGAQRVDANAILMSICKVD